MKHSMVVKFIAVLLCACMVVMGAASALGIILLGEYGLYEDTPEQWKTQRLESAAYTYAWNVAGRYAAENLGNCPQVVIEDCYGFQYEDYIEIYGIMIKQDGLILEDTYTYQTGAISFSYRFTPDYPVIADSDLSLSLGEPLYKEARKVWNGSAEQLYNLAYYKGEEYDVTVFVDLGASTEPIWDTLYMIYGWRYILIGVMAGAVLLFAALLVYLCCAAGRIPGSREIRPGGINRLPLDLYSCAVFMILMLSFDPFMYLLRWAVEDGINWGGASIAAICLMGLSVLGICYVMAISAQVKVKSGFWWQNSVIGRILRWLGRGIQWLIRSALRLFEMLPVIWQWLLTALCMGIAIFFAFVAAVNVNGVWLLLLTGIVCLLVVCYGAYSFGKLIRSAKKMARGELDDKIPTKGLVGCFKDFAGQLNALADVATLAAKKQMKSERMKTELITNVSHDIKTPLTSIINYVDLLQMPHTEEEGREYLAVLDRQSQRMKKLIEDLVEMSKASTGNVNVSIARVDAAEAVHQALGEFADKLEAARLTPVVRLPENSVAMMADGRLVWRVLSNVLSNAVKYALPGTRLYVDVVRLDSKVLISLKNISREELNVSAEELMERFVRGDQSRNTEGSGLGLNIARGLMEVQNGQLQLLVDGDLFKVTLVFPGV